MKKTSKLSRAAFLVAFSFGINKLLAIGRQLIIARQFGLSSELDVFNVANNVPVSYTHLTLPTKRIV